MIKRKTKSQFDSKCGQQKKTEQKNASRESKKKMEKIYLFLRKDALGFFFCVCATVAVYKLFVVVNV